MKKPKLLTLDEALQLNRKQIVDRMNQTQRHWDARLSDDGLSRRALSEAERQELVEFGNLVRKYLPLGVMLDGSIAYASGATSEDFLLERVDGSPPRPPRRVKLSRRRGATMPVTAIKCARPGPYGNPFTVAEHGDMAIPMFADMLERRRHNRREAIVVPYPSDEQIRAELGYWDLACWCDLPPDGATPDRDLCHVDVLLRVAAGGSPLHPVKAALRAGGAR